MELIRLFINLILVCIMTYFSTGVGVLV